MRTKVAFAIVAMAVLTGCGEWPTGVALASSLTGSWSVVESIAGNGFVVSSEAHFTGRSISNQLKGTMQYGVASGTNPPTPTTVVR